MSSTAAGHGRVIGLAGGRTPVHQGNSLQGEVGTNN